MNQEYSKINLPGPFSGSDWKIYQYEEVNKEKGRCWGQETQDPMQKRGRESPRQMFKDIQGSQLYSRPQEELPRLEQETKQTATKAR